MAFRCSANQVLESGTTAKDVICKHASDNPPLLTSPPTTSPAIPLPITVPGKWLCSIAYSVKEL